MENELLKKIDILKHQQANTIEDIYDEGFYNGIELALSLFENREANFKYTVRDKSK